MGNAPKSGGIRDDLASLPLPPESLWYRTPTRRVVGSNFSIVLVGALVGAAALVAVTLPLADQLRQLDKHGVAGSSIPTSRPTPPASPIATGYVGTASFGGRLVEIVGSTVIVDTVEHGAVSVDISHVAEVWRETTVETSSLRLGDELMIDGTPGVPYAALHIYANIGRVDGIVHAIDATGMTIEVRARDGSATLQRIDFSPYIEYGTPAQPQSRTELLVGTQVGAVLYRAPGETPRATRIWW